jgi:hypothetical protein
MTAATKTAETSKKIELAEQELNKVSGGIMNWVQTSTDGLQSKIARATVQNGYMADPQPGRLVR